MRTSDDTRRAGDRPGARPCDRVVFGQHADVDGTVDEDPVSAQHAVEIVERDGQVAVDEVLDHRLEGFFVGQVLHRAADAGPVRVVALARDEITDVIDFLTRVERVEKPGERTQIERGRAETEQMVLQPCELSHDRAHNLAPRRDLDAEKFFDGVVPADVVGDRREIIHPRHDRDVLVVIEILAQLLKPGVQVADVRRAARNPLTIEFEHEPERGVGRGVLGPEVEHPAVAGVHVAIDVVDPVGIDREALVWLQCVRHREKSLSIVCGERRVSPARRSRRPSEPVAIRS